MFRSLITTFLILPASSIHMERDNVTQGNVTTSRPNSSLGAHVGVKASKKKVITTHAPNPYDDIQAQEYQTESSHTAYSISVDGKPNFTTRYSELHHAWEICQKNFTEDKRFPSGFPENKIWYTKEGRLTGLQVWFSKLSLDQLNLFKRVLGAEARSWQSLRQ